MKTTLCSLSLTLAVVGCGASEGGIDPTSTPSPMMKTAAVPEAMPSQILSFAVRTSEDLPECTEALQGQLGYVISTRQFHTCQSLSWEVIDISGETGAQGPQGVPGERGETGAQGPQGVPGERGETGAQGVQGERGERGETGAQGVQGETGAVGPQGLAGLNGTDGRDGVDGAPGAVGPQGPQGSAGVAGTNGIDGLSTGIRILSASIESCPTGGVTVQAFGDSNRNGLWDAGETLHGSALSVCNGATGAQGIQGETGATGAQGIAGSDASTKITTAYRCAATLSPSGFQQATAYTNTWIKSVNIDLKAWRFANGDLSIQGSIWWIWKDSFLPYGLPSNQTTNIDPFQETVTGPIQRFDGPTQFVPSAPIGDQTYSGILNIWQGRNEGTWTATLHETTSTLDLVLVDDLDTAPARGNGSWSNVSCVKTTY